MWPHFGLQHGRTERGGQCFKRSVGSRRKALGMWLFCAPFHLQHDRMRLFQHVLSHHRDHYSDRVAPAVKQSGVQATIPLSTSVKMVPQVVN
jgi:hypothetical protein